MFDIMLAGARGAERLLANGMLSHLGKAVGKPIHSDEVWSAWNVCQLQGWLPESYVFQEWDQLGTSPFPRFVRQVRYLPASGSVEIEEGRKVDPSVLHRSWHLLGPLE